MYNILEKDTEGALTSLLEAMTQVLTEVLFQWKLSREEGHFKERTANT